MRYYEVIIADRRYQSDKPLTYSHETELKPLSVVSVPLQSRFVTGFVSRVVNKPKFTLKPIKAVLTEAHLPKHSLDLAKWMKGYYACSLGEALRQFAPSSPNLGRSGTYEPVVRVAAQLDFTSELTTDQRHAINSIEKGQANTYLLHGDTGTGKTRVYIELAKTALESGRSVILLTPEIALTTQLETATKAHLPFKTFVFHSHLRPAERKKLWFEILQTSEPIVVIGPRSALFTPVQKIGLIILDEAHEPAYKQEQSPRYQTSRVASQLAHLVDAKVVLGSATPLVSDYYLAANHGSIVEMKLPAISHDYGQTKKEIIDIKDRQNFTKNGYLSNQLIEAINKALLARQQSLIYLNRRGTARVVMCSVCGWQLNCPHCDVAMVYHGDAHQVRCHICGRTLAPPLACPVCKNPDLAYRSIGTKALVEAVARLFPEARIARFDSDNKSGERLHEHYANLAAGEIDILIGTQQLAKGFDLPRLALVGIVAAESSLAIPDFTAEERTFQLIYQVAGRVGRGHGAGKVIIQSYDPANVIIKAALARDWSSFYNYTLEQRKLFRFPPYSYLAKFVCRRSSAASAEAAAQKLRSIFAREKLNVEIVGPAPAFYGKKSGQYFWQLVLKSKSRAPLLKLAELVPANWSIDLDPINLL